MVKIQLCRSLGELGSIPRPHVRTNGARKSFSCVQEWNRENEEPRLKPMSAGLTNSLHPSKNLAGNLPLPLLVRIFKPLASNSILTKTTTLCLFAPILPKTSLCLAPVKLDIQLFSKQLLYLIRNIYWLFENKKSDLKVL